MIFRLSERLKSRLKTMGWLRIAIRRQGLILRILVCWSLATLLFLNDEKNDFDTRFKIRNEQPTSEQIVLLNLSPLDMSRFFDFRTKNLLNLNELGDVTDSFFWDQKIWYEMLKVILEQNPKSIGVTLFFGEQLGPLALSRDETQIFLDRRVFWSGQIGSFDQMIPPIFARRDLSNVGNGELNREEDGIIRKVMSGWTNLPLLSERLLSKRIPLQQNSNLINFRGPRKSFESVTLLEVLNQELPKDFFKDKVVLIGSESPTSSRFLTPVGLLSRTEIMAQVTDNLSENRWIQKYPPVIYILYALIVVLIGALIITQYPQSVAFAFYFWIGLFCLSLSVWMFDTFYVWIPALSTIIVLFIMWVIFVGYQASRIERRNYMLEQEQKYLQELEQLKNNFVSLISHDLKTPLAKMQAVVDRLKSQNLHEIQKDVTSLESSTTELNRYIQSIIKVMRVESRDFQLNLVATDLNELTEEVLSSLQPLAEEKNLKMVSQLEPLFLLDLDAILMREVIHNLIENAIKYSPAGQEILVRSFESETEIGFLVTDQGEGIPLEEHVNVWGKFVRGQNQSMKSKGTGLGLYLVKYFVELHGGRVTLQSELGRGTQIGFYLPL